MLKSMFVAACFATLLTGCPDPYYGRARGVDRERVVDRERHDQKVEEKHEDRRTPEEERRP
jgi:hypothetical protein